MQIIDFDKKDGFNPDEWNKIVVAYRDWQGKGQVVFRKPLRTNPQNARYWKMIIEHFSIYTGYDKQETHQLLSKKFLAYEKKGKSGKVQLFVKSTTELNTKEFCEYCDQCEQFGNEHGLIFPSLREDEY